MNDRLTAAALTLAHIALIGGLAASTLATPAQAQEGVLGRVAAEGATCPAGWSNPKLGGGRSDSTVCVVSSSNARAVYRRQAGETCKPGYNTGSFWCEKAPAAYVHKGSTDSLEKPNKTDRCPTGWFTTGNGMTCVTQMKEPTSSRLKAGKACRANEVDEWGVWCTSNYETLTPENISSWAMRDYNAMYAFNRGVVAAFAGNDLDEQLLTPVHRKLFGNAPAKAAPAAQSATSATNTAPTPSKVCETAAQQGAALGGALGGSRGQALGGLAGAALGGFGKKKTGC